MNSILVYHDSKVKVEIPEIIRKGYFKDFGYGFYVTEYKGQAEKWASRHKDGFVSVFRLDLSYKDKLDNLKFESVNDDWLKFIANCRKGEKHKYDTVEGAMADDTIYNYVNDYLSGLITKEAFMELCKFKHPTHQIVFNTERSLKYLEFRRCYSVQRKVL